MANPTAAYKAGTIPFAYEGEIHNTYYVVFGDLENRTKVPLIVLHGGPGLVHDYMLPFSDLSVTADIPVILYDQIGNGRSTHLRDKPHEFWKIDLWVEELANLVEALGIQDAFALAGHSWGGILAVKFELRKWPQGLKKLILSNSLASYDLWIQSTMQLMQAFPGEVQEGLKLGMKDPKKYDFALKAFHGVHGCVVDPMPELYTYSLAQALDEDGDPSVANAPVLNEWSVIDRLHQVRVPTLVINGRNDISQDFVIAPFFQNIPQVRWLTFERSTHTPFWEERELYFERVAWFLDL